METVGLHPGGIISPICPEISSSGICQYVMEIFAALPPFGSQSCSNEALLLSIVCCAHKSVTSHKYRVLHREKLFCISNKLTFYCTRGRYQSRRGSQKCLFSCFFVIVFWPAGSVLYLFYGNMVTCKDTCILSKSVCVFTFMVFNIHCSLGLQQQRDQLLVTTQSSMVQRCQPSHRHRLGLKIHIFVYVV